MQRRQRLLLIRSMNKSNKGRVKDNEWNALCFFSLFIFKTEGRKKVVPKKYLRWDDNKWCLCVACDVKFVWIFNYAKSCESRGREALSWKLNNLKRLKHSRVASEGWKHDEIEGNNLSLLHVKRCRKKCEKTSFVTNETCVNLSCRICHNIAKRVERVGVNKTNRI